MNPVSIAPPIIVPEPDWPALFNDELDQANAKEYWRLVVDELRDRSLLSGANGHSIQRLVCFYIMFDRMYRIVAEAGPVLQPKKSNKTAIARISPHFSAMREAGNEATALEAELGISPRRRSTVSKAERAKKLNRASDSYLKNGTNG